MQEQLLRIQVRDEWIFGVILRGGIRRCRPRAWIRITEGKLDSEEEYRPLQHMEIYFRTDGSTLPRRYDAVHIMNPRLAVFPSAVKKNRCVIARRSPNYDP